MRSRVIIALAAVAIPLAACGPDAPAASALPPYAGYRWNVVAVTDESGRLSAAGTDSYLTFGTDLTIAMNTPLSELTAHYRATRGTFALTGQSEGAGYEDPYGESLQHRVDHAMNRLLETWKSDVIADVTGDTLILKRAGVRIVAQRGRRVRTARIDPDPRESPHPSPATTSR